MVSLTTISLISNDMACTSAADFLPATALQGGLGLRAYDLGDATCVAMGPSIWSCMRQPCPNVLREVEETMPHDPAHGGHTQAAGCRASCPPGSKVADDLKVGRLMETHPATRGQFWRERAERIASAWVTDMLGFHRCIQCHQLRIPCACSPRGRARCLGQSFPSQPPGKSSRGRSARPGGSNNAAWEVRPR